MSDKSLYNRLQDALQEGIRGVDLKKTIVKVRNEIPVDNLDLDQIYDIIEAVDPELVEKHQSYIGILEERVQCLEEVLSELCYEICDIDEEGYISPKLNKDIKDTQSYPSSYKDDVVIKLPDVLERVFLELGWGERQKIEDDIFCDAEGCRKKYVKAFYFEETPIHLCNDHLWLKEAM